MIKESNDLLDLVKQNYEIFSSIDEKTASLHAAEDKWCLKEILGHLIDSASNNQQRFMRLQEETELQFPVYSLEWVQIARYSSYSFSGLLELWKEYNMLMAHIIKHIDESCLQNIWQTAGGPHTLEFLVRDYISHFRWHIRHFKERWSDAVEM